MLEKLHTVYPLPHHAFCRSEVNSTQLHPRSSGCKHFSINPVLESRGFASWCHRSPQWLVVQTAARERWPGGHRRATPPYPPTPGGGMPRALASRSAADTITRSSATDLAGCATCCCRSWHFCAGDRRSWTVLNCFLQSFRGWARRTSSIQSHSIRRQGLFRTARWLRFPIGMPVCFLFGPELFRSRPAFCTFAARTPDGSDPGTSPGKAHLGEIFLWPGYPRHRTRAACQRSWSASPQPPVGALLGAAPAAPSLPLQPNVVGWARRARARPLPARPSSSSSTGTAWGLVPSIFCNVFCCTFCWMPGQEIYCAGCAMPFVPRFYRSFCPPGSLLLPITLHMP